MIGSPYVHVIATRRGRSHDGTQFRGSNVEGGLIQHFPAWIPYREEVKRRMGKDRGVVYGRHLRVSSTPNGVLGKIEHEFTSPEASEMGFTGSRSWSKQRWTQARAGTVCVCKDKKERSREKILKQSPGNLCNCD